MSSFRVIITEQTCTEWLAEMGIVKCFLPQSLFPKNMQVSLESYSFENKIFNLPVSHFGMDGEIHQLEARRLDRIEELFSLLKQKTKGKLELTAEGPLTRARMPEGSSFFPDLNLRQILGFTDSVVTNGQLGPEGWSIYGAIPHMRVGWEALTKQICGNNYCKVLGILSDRFKNVPFGQTVWEEVRNPAQKSVEAGELSEIVLKITTDRNQPVSFFPGTPFRFVICFYNLL